MHFNLLPDVRLAALEKENILTLLRILSTSLEIMSKMVYEFTKDLLRKMTQLNGSNNFQDFMD